MDNKEAIKYLQNEIIDIQKTIDFYVNKENIIFKEELDAKQTILDLISKLQKENEELRNFNSYLSNSDIDYLEGENIKLQKENDTLKTTINKQSKDISEQLKELDKKDKVISLMTKAIFYEDNSNPELRKLSTCEIIKEYFYKKVEEENE